MRIIYYNDLKTDDIPAIDKLCRFLENDNFVQADVRKIKNNLYRARLNRNDRILFSLYSYEGETYCLLLEYIKQHAYEKSRFLNRDVVIDEDKLPSISSSDNLEPTSLVYLNKKSASFNILDKVISFDDHQQAVYQLSPPVVIIGSAGSGKTALTLEKMKQTSGDVLYVSLSPYLVQSARNLYYANHYNNENQEVDFLSFKELLESIQVPEGHEITVKHFESWFARNKGNSKLKNSHKLFEEFRGVLTGPSIDKAWLARDEYLSLGVKQSIFNEEERPTVYELFERYLKFLTSCDYYDHNILSFEYQKQATARYDFIVVDEVQDITNIQLFLVLKMLRHEGQFILCGDSNQIVHPNFFSWSKVKSLFFQQSHLTGQHELTRILQSNYRNAPVVTDIANHILKIKQARFGSVDKESNYLVESIGQVRGRLQLLADNNQIKQELNSKTARSTHFAVIVMHPEQKELAKKNFNTPLVFSIQEAKGLEYENIILYNFISDEEKAFREISAGVDPSALQTNTLDYARTKDKRDKSLEVYKFYINALYVAVTRAVNSLYLVESNLKHPLIKLLDLTRFNEDLVVDQQASSLEEWQREARKLELQGKQEQADEIRSNILQIKPVPWPVIDAQAFEVIRDKALSEKNKKQQILALEYAHIYYHKPTINALKKAGIQAAKQPGTKVLVQLYRKHYMVYDLKQIKGVLRDTENYGVDHKTIFNLTPLMVAAKIGNTELVAALIDSGANAELTANNGFNALHMALEMGFYNEKYVSAKLSAVYPLLEPDSLSLQIEGRLVKLDKHLMALTLLNIMFVMFYRFFGGEIGQGCGFTAKAIAVLVEKLPDSVLSKKRKRQAYISSVLSSNEVNRDFKYNRKLFKRIKYGHYMINPGLKLRQGEDWISVYQLLKPEDLGITPAIEKYNCSYNKNTSSFIGQFDQSQIANIKAFVHSVTNEQVKTKVVIKNQKSRTKNKKTEIV